MKILLTNDDGVDAANILALHKQLLLEGHDAWLVAPERERSAQSHTITLHKPMRVRKHREHGDNVYSVSGTPVDAVYIAVHKLMDQKPDIVISGINHGFNLGSDVFYSGTVAGALEGAFRGARAIAFSANRECEPEPLAKLALSLLHQLFAVLDDWHVLNINIPSVTPKGIKMAGLGQRSYDERVEERRDPRGSPYYWIGGNLPPLAGDMSTDVGVVAAGYVSVSPLSVTLGAPLETIGRLKLSL